MTREITPHGFSYPKPGTGESANVPEDLKKLALEIDGFAAALPATIAAGVKRGVAWLNTVTAPPTGDNLPVVSVATTSQVTGTLIAPKRIGDVSGAALDVDNDPAFRYDGGPGGDSVTADFVGPQAWSLGTWSLHPEFVTGRVAEFEVRLRPTGTTLAFRVEVDGKPLTVGLDKRTVTAGSDQWVRLVFPTAAVRTIKVWLTSTAFGGVKVPSGTATRPSAPVRRRLGVAADSFGGGALDSLRGETFAYYLSKLLEADSLINVSRGGTGWCEDATPNNPFVERIPALLAMQPHIFFGVGSRNDFDHTTDEVYAAARDALALTSAVPAVYAAGPAQSPFAAQNTGVSNGAGAAGVPFINVLSVITGATTGSDGIHPTPQGHLDLAVALNDGVDRAALDARVAAFQGTPVTLSLTGSSNPVSQGTPVTFTATTTPAAAGQIQFRDSGALIGTATLNPTTGVATLTTSTLPTGTRSIAAEYRPSSPRFSRASSAALTLVVAPPALTDVITTNLLAEITAESLSLADGAAVASLTPARGSRVEPLVQATTATQPSFVAAGSHGKKAMRFQADRLDAPDWATATVAGTPLTFYTVHRMAALGSGTQYVFRGAATGTQVSYQHASASGAYGASTTVSGTPAPQQHQTDVAHWQITAITYDGGVVTTRQNTITTPGTVNLSTTSLSLDGIGLGSFGGGTTGYDLYVSAVYAYSGRHTNDEITQMMLYLSSRWNVPLDEQTTPAPDPGTGESVATNTVYGPRWVFDGDSITIGAIDGTTAGQTRGLSWTTELAGQALGAINYVTNAAVGGQTSTDALARFDAQVAPRTPDVVLLTIGTNDVGNGVALATTIANLTAYHAKCKAIGARLIVGAIWPHNDSARAATTRARNDAIYAWADARDLDVIPWDRLADPATGGWPAGWADAQGTHPTAATSGDALTQIGKFGHQFLAPKLGAASAVRRAVVNGSDLLLNGFSTTRDAPLAAPAITNGVAATGTGSLAAGAYSYKMTNRTLYGESLASAERAVTLSATGQITLTLGTTSGNRGKRIYRKAPGETTWRLIARVGSNVTSYVDDGTAVPTTVLTDVDTSTTPTGLLSNGGTARLHQVDIYGAPFFTEPGIRGVVTRLTPYEDGDTTDPADYFLVEGLTAGQVLDVSLLVRGSSPAGTDPATVYQQVMLRFRDAGTTQIANYTLGRGQFTGPGFRLLQARVTVPSGATRVRLSLELDALANYIDYAELRMALV